MDSQVTITDVHHLRPLGFCPTMETGPTCHQALGVASHLTASLGKENCSGITPGATVGDMGPGVLRPEA